MDAHGGCASEAHTYTPHNIACLQVHTFMHVCTHAVYTRVHAHTHTPPQSTDDSMLTCHE